MNNQNFQTAANQGLELLNQWSKKYSIEVLPESDEFSRTDVLMKKGKKLFVAEIKVRGFDYRLLKLCYSGQLIELKKYNSIKEKAAELNAIPLYIVFFPENNIVTICNLDKCELQYERKLCPKTSKGDTTKVYKDIYSIDFESFMIENVTEDNI